MERPFSSPLSELEAELAWRGHSLLGHNDAKVRLLREKMDRDRRAKLHFFTSILCAILGNVQELQKEAEAYMSAIGCLSIKDKAPEEPVDAEKMFKELMENLRKPTESRNAG